MGQDTRQGSFAVARGEEMAQDKMVICDTTQYNRKRYKKNECVNDKKSMIE